MEADEADRVRVGASRVTAPGLLARLAEDPSVKVRAALALNPAAPLQAEFRLSHDADERVRILLARKLGSLLPTLSATAQTELREQTLQTLTTLVADEADRVRAAVAEEVKHLPDVPRELILRLAHDASVMVCEPVILFSPLLSTADLVALVVAPPSSHTALAVARRPMLDEAASDAIADAADNEVIRALLGNASAQIREATLDALVARAATQPEWHAPLVNRPALSTHAARVLSQIVATHLLEVLAARRDLDAALTNDLRQHLAARVAAQREVATDASEPPFAAALSSAKELAAAGKLSESVVMAAARRGEVHKATALLAVAADVPVATVERAASLRSTKGIVSLVWKAGFSMQTALALQPLLARLSPSSSLRAGPAGAFPLAPDEMRWQIDFLCRTGR